VQLLPDPPFSQKENFIMYLDQDKRMVYEKRDDKFEMTLDAIDYFAGQPVMCAGFLFMIMLFFVMI
jgi:hypothetical protein